ncbi:expressed unknown protein [Seminavis robusta]|uniref:Uncharacterized protein n=1 Tax=Seminavis robusta TaxID=568900 RepID=A0A9N8H5M5_9STRA|nr:expressed unknown protein [Seminavis robusta]|eukprot:Sro118_g057830.1 n/a (285) ;mRNA; r:85607-86461
MSLAVIEYNSAIELAPPEDQRLLAFPVVAQQQQPSSAPSSKLSASLRRDTMKAAMAMAAKERSKEPIGSPKRSLETAICSSPERRQFTSHSSSSVVSPYPASAEGSPAKKHKRECHAKRVSFSDKRSVLEVQTCQTDHEKEQAWYRSEDFSQFVYMAQHDAQVLRHAAECATSAKALYQFIQSNPDLNPRGLEKVLHYEACANDQNDTDDDDDDDEKESALTSHSKKIRMLKHRHRRVLLSMHQVQKQTGSHNPEELRKFSEDSSQWAVQMALKLGHIDAHGLI